MCSASGPIKAPYLPLLGYSFEMCCTQLQEEKFLQRSLSALVVTGWLCKSPLGISNYSYLFYNNILFTLFSLLNVNIKKKKVKKGFFPFFMSDMKYSL